MTTEVTTKEQNGSVDQRENKPADLAAIRAEAAEVLGRMRKDKQPTRRGILLCGEMMGRMLRLGWDKDDLDSCEILFWASHDGDGNLLQRPAPVARTNATP